MTTRTKWIGVFVDNPYTEEEVEIEVEIQMEHCEGDYLTPPNTDWKILGWKRFDRDNWLSIGYIDSSISWEEVEEEMNEDRDDEPEDRHYRGHTTYLERNCEGDSDE